MPLRQVGLRQKTTVQVTDVPTSDTSHRRRHWTVRWGDYWSAHMNRDAHVTPYNAMILLWLQAFRLIRMLMSPPIIFTSAVGEWSL
jgi:hypothetical protein